MFLQFSGCFNHAPTYYYYFCHERESMATIGIHFPLGSSREYSMDLRFPHVFACNSIIIDDVDISFGFFPKDDTWLRIDEYTQHIFIPLVPHFSKGILQYTKVLYSYSCDWMREAIDKTNTKEEREEEED